MTTTDIHAKRTAAMERAIAELQIVGLGPTDASCCSGAACTGESIPLIPGRIALAQPSGSSSRQSSMCSPNGTEKTSMIETGKP